MELWTLRGGAINRWPPPAHIWFQWMDSWITAHDQWNGDSSIYIGVASIYI